MNALLNLTDRLSGKLGPLTTLIDAIVDRFAPQVTAQACSSTCGVYCGGLCGVVDGVCAYQQYYYNYYPGAGCQYNGCSACWALGGPNACTGGC